MPNQQKIIIENIRALLAKKINIEAKSIVFMNQKYYLLDPKVRYLYTFVPAAHGNLSGFIKISGKNNRDRLKKEYLNLQLAYKLGFSNLKILYPFKKLDDDYCFFGREKFELGDAIILSDSKIISKAPLEFGFKIGRFLFSIAGKKAIPENTDFKLIKSRDIRNRTISAFWFIWNRICQSFFSPANKKAIKKYTDFDFLEEQTQILAKEITPIIKEAKEIKTQYFVHNDTAPNNVFLVKKSTDYKVSLLDFEYSGCTNNSFLAQVTDLCNFYSRLWPNPKLQRSFLDGCKKSRLSKKDYLALKTALIFGTLDSANRNFKSPSRHHHVVFKALLKSFKTNFEYLEHLAGKN